MILVNSYRRHDWLLEAIPRRLREEFAKLDLRVNEAKSRIVDLGRGESFGFLGLTSGWSARGGALEAAVHAAAGEATGGAAEAQGGVPAPPSQPVGG